jgi:hypothetical protein
MSEDQKDDDRMFLDYPCPKCGGDVGHLINCPDGSAFTQEHLDKVKREELEWIESKKLELENPEETFRKKYINEFPKKEGKG